MHARSRKIRRWLTLLGLIIGLAIFLLLDVLVFESRGAAPDEYAVNVPSAAVPEPVGPSPRSNGDVPEMKRAELGESATQGSGIPHDFDYSFDGTLTSGGNPVANARVTYCNTRATTGEDGLFTFERALPLSVLRIEHSAFPTHAGYARNNHERYDLAESSQATIRVTRNGKGEDNVLVRLFERWYPMGQDVSTPEPLLLYEAMTDVKGVAIFDSVPVSLEVDDGFNLVAVCSIDGIDIGSITLLESRERRRQQWHVTFRGQVEAQDHQDRTTVRFSVAGRGSAEVLALIRKAYYYSGHSDVGIWREITIASNGEGSLPPGADAQRTQFIAELSSGSVAYSARGTWGRDTSVIEVDFPGAFLTLHCAGKLPSSLRVQATQIASRGDKWGYYDIRTAPGLPGFREWVTIEPPTRIRLKGWTGEHTAMAIKLQPIDFTFDIMHNLGSTDIEYQMPDFCKTEFTSVNWSLSDHSDRLFLKSVSVPWATIPLQRIAPLFSVDLPTGKYIVEYIDPDWERMTLAEFQLSAASRKVEIICPLQ